MVNFLFSTYFDGHFYYHSNRQSHSNLRILHFGYSSNKLIRTNWQKTTFIFKPHMGVGGGQKRPLMYVAFCASFEANLCRWFGPFSLSLYSFLCPSLWKESRHDRNIIDWDLHKPHLNQKRIYPGSAREGSTIW